MIDEWHYKRVQWRETFALIPRRCDLSGRWIWGRHVCGTRFITGPGDTVEIIIGNHRHEHTIYRLKGKQK